MKLAHPEVSPDIVSGWYTVATGWRTVRRWAALCRLIEA